MMKQNMAPLQAQPANPYQQQGPYLEELLLGPKTRQLNSAGLL